MNKFIVAHFTFSIITSPTTCHNIIWNVANKGINSIQSIVIITAIIKSAFHFVARQIPAIMAWFGNLISKFIYRQLECQSPCTRRYFISTINVSEHRFSPFFEIEILSFFFTEASTRFRSAVYYGVRLYFCHSSTIAKTAPFAIA